MMNTRFNILGILVSISLLLSGCGALVVPSGHEDLTVPKTAIYESILGKPLTNNVVVGSGAENSCSNAGQSLLCNSVGMALRTDSNQVVETVYLYLNNAEGFELYKGELPFGLKLYDTMGAKEYKLKR